MGRSCLGRILSSKLRQKRLCAHSSWSKNQSLIHGALKGMCQTHFLLVIHPHSCPNCPASSSHASHTMESLACSPAGMKYRQVLPVLLVGMGRGVPWWGVETEVPADTLGCGFWEVGAGKQNLLALMRSFCPVRLTPRCLQFFTTVPQRG